MKYLIEWLPSPDMKRQWSLLAPAGVLGAALLTGLAHAAGPDTRVETPDWREAELLFEIEWAGERLEALALSPGGQHLAMTAQGRLEVRDLASGELRHRLPGHPAADGDLALPISALAFSPDDRMLATTSWSQGASPEASLILWDLTTGDSRQALAGGEGCHDVVFEPDGKALWAACGAGVQRYSLDDGRITSDLGDRPVEAIALHPDGGVLASVAAALGPDPEVSRHIELWQLSAEAPSQIGSLDAGTRVEGLAFTPEGRHLVSQARAETHGEGSGQVMVWDWQRGASLYRHAASSSTPVAMSPEGAILAGGFRDGLLLALDGTPIEHGILIRQQGGADALAFGSSGDLLAWAGKPPTFPTPLVRLWQATGSDSVQDEPVDNDYQRIESPEVEATDVPVALAREHYGLQEFSPGTEETVTQTMLPDGDLRVTLTLEGLKDDSVGALRYRLQFESANEGRWQLVEVARQQQCLRGGADQDEWTSQLCP